MTNSAYPSTPAEIDAWRRENVVTSREARLRFMEFAVLRCVASHAVTRKSMVLKGGNALRFVYQSPRSTKDLDFSVDTDGIPDNEDKIRDLLNNALAWAERRFNVKAKCQRVKRKPKQKLDSTHPTYDVGIGYQFPDDRYFHNFDDHNSPMVIPLEISLNDLVCETAEWADVRGLRVCSLEDILAEKLRSLLQQKPRNRNRWQDVYDICTYVRQSGIDQSKITEYLRAKSSIRGIELRKSNFDNEIRERAAFDFEVHVKTQAPRHFISFDDAWRDVVSLVQCLDIPD